MHVTQGLASHWWSSIHQNVLDTDAPFTKAWLHSNGPPHLRQCFFMKKKPLLHSNARYMKRDIFRFCQITTENKLKITMMLSIPSLKRISEIHTLVSSSLLFHPDQGHIVLWCLDPRRGPSLCLWRRGCATPHRRPGIWKTFPGLWFALKTKSRIVFKPSQWPVTTLNIKN